jgi:hypothetical protein
MKTLNRTLALAGIAATLWLGTVPVAAQGRQGGQGGPGGNFDPEQMRQRMMERYREDLGVKGDDEWKLISERIQKVTEARRDVGFGGGFGRMGRPGGPGAPAGGNDTQGDQNQRRRNPFGTEPSVAATELQQAIDGNASADQIKVKLAKYREDRKAKQAALDKAQDELKKVLSVKQEAVAVLRGLLN